jgi:hypothetical protein
MGTRKSIDFIKGSQLPEHLIRRFPKLLADRARKTSEPTLQYNCIAWSAERDENHWWEPTKWESWVIWPEDAKPDDYSLENFVRLFENRGYKKCEGPQFEFLYKKLAIYAIYGYFEKDKWGFSHVCDQLNTGAWTSKLGKDEDIRHNSLDALAGEFEEEYGEIRVIMKRKCGIGCLMIRAFLKIASIFKISANLI